MRQDLKQLFSFYLDKPLDAATINLMMQDLALLCATAMRKDEAQPSFNVRTDIATMNAGNMPVIPENLHTFIWAMGMEDWVPPIEVLKGMTTYSSIRTGHHYELTPNGYVFRQNTRETMAAKYAAMLTPNKETPQ